MKQQIFISAHAMSRMLEMGVDRREVVDAVEHPEVSWSGTRDDADSPATTSKRGRISVVTFIGKLGDTVVATVLWNTQDRYRRAEHDQEEEVDG